MAAYMAGYRERPKRKRPAGMAFRPLRDQMAGHCIFCGLETGNDPQVCNLCRHEIEEAS